MISSGLHPLFHVGRSDRDAEWSARLERERRTTDEFELATRKSLCREWENYCRVV